MKTQNEQQADGQKVQLYLHRVNDFFSQIKEWFKDELAVETTAVQVGETLGTYETLALSIRDKSQNKSLAKITPKGASVPLAKGLLECC